MTLYALLVLSALLLLASGRQIDRRQVVRCFNPQRNASSTSTPMQVGNGNFAFGVDVTGLQTFQSFGTLSSWGWHNISLPMTPGQSKPEDFTGLNWWTHGRLVNYAQPNPAQSEISTWMIQNPHRLNLGRVGFWFGGQDVKESDLSGTSQTLDLYSGQISSSFSFNGTEVKIKTSVDPNSDTVALQIDSDLLNRGQLGLFFDFPYGTLNKFDAPFVGNFSMVARHATSLKQTKGQAAIRHDLDSTTYFTSLKWEGQASVTGPITGTHRYVLQPVNASSSLKLSVNFAPKSQEPKATAKIAKVSADWWESYWQRGAFIDLTSSGNSTAVELQRRIILSQYLLAVNDAGNDPPQESGLTNNG